MLTDVTLPDWMTRTAEAVEVDDTPTAATLAAMPHDALVRRVIVLHGEKTLAKLAQGTVSRALEAERTAHAATREQLAATLATLEGALPAEEPEQLRLVRWDLARLLGVLHLPCAAALAATLPVGDEQWASVREEVRHVTRGDACRHVTRGDACRHDQRAADVTAWALREGDVAAAAGHLADLDGYTVEQWADLTRVASTERDDVPPGNRRCVGCGGTGGFDRSCVGCGGRGYVRIAVGG